MVDTWFERLDHRAMLNGLNLGDLILDARRFIFVKSLNALVCADFQMDSEDQGAVFIKTISDLKKSYGFETLVIIGGVFSAANCHVLGSILSTCLVPRLFVVTESQWPALASLGAEVHHELVWGKYRFTESIEPGVVEKYFLSSIGTCGASLRRFTVRVGKAGFGRMHLPVFLKGLGQLILPGLSDATKEESVFQKIFDRYDVFAAGHHKVFAMGKVGDLRPLRTAMGRIPLSVETLAHRQGHQSSAARK